MANSFDVLKKMATDDKDIGATKTLVSAKTAPGGGHITMGVPPEWLHKIALMEGKYEVALLVWNKDEYKVAEAALDLAEAQRPKSQVASGSPVSTSLDGCPFHYCDSKPQCTERCRYSEKSTFRSNSDGKG